MSEARTRCTIHNCTSVRGYTASIASEIHPSVSQVWRRNWVRITPFFNYSADIRKAIYTTNSVESLNRSLRKIIKTVGGFP